ncbi:Fur family transcriptional regulator [Mariprofundus ferrooxydans]|uniref:Ferric uptake regulation protein n=1 Tax=Mariprofundus ferrooxydans PV-1 TaxID=314345 RepID=Q0F3R4_9PROT|nr:Fur family transcriptional regulator [Mariprofundus ferrooxydans]EAU55877.1 Fe2+/Zn2+ uptake regulation proteins [Mariprofundus ferrooxydans PV-1]KON48158.1 Fe2+/Zn2+ uptake regulation protein [Mariprofundus ferrooxydans]
MSTNHEISTLLRSHGLRLTPQRLAVAGLVLPRHTHVTARSVYQQLKNEHPALSMNTVYLTLGQLESCNLLNRFEINGNAVFDSNTLPHDHACCSKCGTIIDLPGAQPELPLLPTALKEWQIYGEQRIWIGLCPACIGTDG